MNLKTFLVPLFLLSIATNATMFDEHIKVDIKKLTLASIENNLIGDIYFTYLLFSNQFANIELNENSSLKGNILIDSSYIQLKTDTFTYNLPNLMGLDGLKYHNLNLINTSFEVVNNILSLQSESSELEIPPFKIKATLYDFDCYLENNKINAEQCLNNTDIKPLETSNVANITLDSYDFKLLLQTNHATISPDSFNLNSEKLLFNHKLFDLSINDANIQCSKPWLTMPINSQTIFTGCIKQGEFNKGMFDVSFPSAKIKIKGINHSIKTNNNNFDIKLKNIDLEMDKHKLTAEDTLLNCNIETNLILNDKLDFNNIITECTNDINTKIENINYTYETLSTQIDHIQYVAKKSVNSRINTKLVGITGQQYSYYLNIPKIVASCNSTSAFDIQKLIHDCLLDGEIDIPVIDFSDIKTKTQVHIEISDAHIRNNNFYLKAPILTLKMPTITATISNLEANCRRDQEDDPLDFELLQKRCFESSSIQIPLIQATNNQYNLEIQINDISIDKGQLLLNIPQSSYELNDTGIYFEDMHFVCHPNITFETLQELKVSNILENCINNTLITINDVKNINSSGNKTSKFKEIKFNSKNSNFSLTLKTKIMMFPTAVNFSGNINYDKDKSQVILDIKEASAGFLFTKKIILFFIKNFVSDKNVNVYGNKIFITIEQ